MELIKSSLKKIFYVKQSHRKFVKILLIIACLLLLGYIFMRTIAFQAGLNSYISMYPTFETSDRLWVNRISYRFDPPARGDIIVTRDPTGTRRDPEERYIEIIHPFYWNTRLNKFAISPPFGSMGPTWVKRIIGLPGESIEIIDKQVYINGIAYNHGAEYFSDTRVIPLGLGDRISPEQMGIEIFRFAESRDNMIAMVIPDGYFFILGDNRDISLDSRYIGPVARSDILGKVTRIFYTRRDGKAQFFRRFE